MGTDMLKVCKFGGSSLADAAQVGKVCDVVLADAARRVVVVSAPGKRDKTDTKVTDLLIACAEKALIGEPCDAEMQAVIGRYAAIQCELGLPQTVTDAIAADLRRRVAGPKDHAGMFLDCMKAAGEDNSAKLVAAALCARGVAAVYIDPKAAGMRLTDEFGNAQLLPESYPLLRAHLQAIDGIAIFPGFFGYTQAGAVATFSRGGSDITGAILAAALTADTYENFTDVDSVYPVAPRFVPEVQQGITTMTFREMRELSYAGFGVFHDEAVLPAIRAGIPVNIRNTSHPELPGTMVVAEREFDACAVVGIASDDGFVQIYIDKYLMNREVGFGRRLMQILEAEGLSWEHMPTGIDNLSVILREKKFTAAVEQRVLARIQEELTPDNVLVEREHAIIMVVGEGMQYTIGMAAKATRALADADVNIEMLNQGASEISMMFGVRSADHARAVRALYDAYFKTS